MSLCLKTGKWEGTTALAKGCGLHTKYYLSYCVNIVKHSYSLKLLPPKASY